GTDPIHARGELTGLLRREIGDLAVLERRLEAREALDRAEAADRAATDMSPAGQARARFEATQRRALHGAVSDLFKYRAAKARSDDGDDPPRFPPAAPEPPAAGAPSGGEEVPGDGT